MKFKRPQTVQIKTAPATATLGPAVTAILSRLAAVKKATP